MGTDQKPPGRMAPWVVIAALLLASVGGWVAMTLTGVFKSLGPGVTAAIIAADLILVVILTVVLLKRG